MSKCVVCCICKNESSYIEEFVDYHLDLGFDQIIIGDNNDLDGETYNEQLKDYVENGEVVIVNLRGKGGQQIPFYNEILNTYEFDWCAFIDCDEFITMSDEFREKYDNNIHNFLDTAPQEVNVYKLNWMCYGDNGRILKGVGDVIDRFPNPMPFNFTFTYAFPENYHVKPIVRKRVNERFLNQPHAFKTDNIYLPNNKISNESPFNKDLTYDTLYIRHYYTKSLEEWVNKKMKYQFVVRECKPGEECYNIKQYFKYNKINEGKINFLKKCGIAYEG